MTVFAGFAGLSLVELFGFIGLYVLGAGVIMLAVICIQAIGPIAEWLSRLWPGEGPDES